MLMTRIRVTVYRARANKRVTPALEPSTPVPELGPGPTRLGRAPGAAHWTGSLNLNLKRDVIEPARHGRIRNFQVSSGCHCHCHRDSGTASRRSLSTAAE
jgi:hypothetical protein